MQNDHKQTRLSLAPVSYYWDRDRLYDFYQGIADTPVDIVYLGETICSKRRTLDRDDWIEIARLLSSAGKEIVLSTLALVEAASELGAMRHICHNPDFRVEANDIAAVQILSGTDRGFVAGPPLNIYNSQALHLLTKLGLKRWVVPVEHSAEVLAQFDVPDEVETEVFAWGRLPLAYSARCYTARTHGTPKDDCQLRCLDYPDGLTLHTREDEPFLTLNGIQTQSARHQNLIHALQHPGVDIFRISPQATHTDTVIQLFHDCLRGTLSADQAKPELNRLAPAGMSNGYWHGQAGMLATDDLQI